MIFWFWDVSGITLLLFDQPIGVNAVARIKQTARSFGSRVATSGARRRWQAVIPACSGGVGERHSCLFAGDEGCNSASPLAMASQRVSNCSHRLSSGSVVWLTGNSMISQEAGGWLGIDI